MLLLFLAAVGLLVLCSFFLFFLHPFIAIIHSAQSQRLSQGERAFWIIASFFTGPLASICYAVVASESDWLRRNTVRPVCGFFFFAFTAVAVPVCFPESLEPLTAKFTEVMERSLPEGSAVTQVAGPAWEFDIEAETESSPEPRKPVTQIEDTGSAESGLSETQWPQQTSAELFQQIQREILDQQRRTVTRASESESRSETPRWPSATDPETEAILDLFFQQPHDRTPPARNSGEISPLPVVPAAGVLSSPEVRANPFAD